MTGQTIVANPNTGCKTLTNGKDFWGNIAIVYRGDCMFVGELWRVHFFALKVNQEWFYNLLGLQCQEVILIDTNETNQSGESSYLNKVNKIYLN